MFTLNETLARDCLSVGHLPLCQVLLMNDSQYPWLILVPRVAGLRELHQLDESQTAQFWQESRLTSQLLEALFAADKLNIAALGNMVPQLHVHHIGRFVGDPAWPKPIWGAMPALAYADDALADRLVSLRREFHQREPAFVSG